MFVAKVTGSLVSTQKVATMVGFKLLVVEPYRIEPKERKSLATTGRTFIAVDTQTYRLSHPATAGTGGDFPWWAIAIGGVLVAGAFLVARRRRMSGPAA